MKPGKDYIGIGVGVAIFNDNNEVLLMKRGENSGNEKGSWALPGGTVEYGETLEDASIRETREELGVTITIIEGTPAYDHILPEEGQHWVTNVFTAKIISGTPTIMEPGSCEEIGWFALDSLPSPIAKMSAPAITYLTEKTK